MNFCELQFWYYFLLKRKFLEETEVYLSNDIEKHWNGYYKNNKVPEGIYTYLIEVIGEDYQTYNRYGSVNVIY